MKKIFFLSLITILGVIGFLACSKKETVRVESITSNPRLKQMEELTTEFRQQQSLIDESQRKINWKNVMKVAGADLTGSIAGGWIGFQIGTAAPGVGNGVGLLIGSVIGGAGASLTAAGTLSQTNPDFSPIYPQSINFSLFVDNTDNDFDSIGLFHYKLCAKHMVNNSGSINPYSFYPFAKYEFQDKLGIDTSITNYFTRLHYDESILRTVSDDYETSPSDILLDLDNREMLTGDVKEYLSYYIFAFEDTKDIVDFCTYSIDAEEIVNADSTLSSTDKQQILISMATARYGIQFWSEI